MKTLRTLKAELLADTDTRREYDALAGEFNMARELIAARSRAGLTQLDVAQRMGTTQSAIARLEGGAVCLQFEPCNATRKPWVRVPWCTWKPLNRFCAS